MSKSDIDYAVDGCSCLDKAETLLIYRRFIPLDGLLMKLVVGFVASFKLFGVKCLYHIMLSNPIIQLENNLT